MQKEALQQANGKSFDDRLLLQTGYVEKVNSVGKGKILEIRLFLPLVNMQDWTEVPYIKFAVGGTFFRKYTPATWDAKDQICTLFIDAAHDGPGANWASKLRGRDLVQYIKVGSSRQSPHPVSRIVGLGDATSIGQLLALFQMTNPYTRFSGVLLITDHEQFEYCNKNLSPYLYPVLCKDTAQIAPVISWINAQRYSIPDTCFYITGNDFMVIQLKKSLIAMGFAAEQIKVNGFWS